MDIPDVSRESGKWWESGWQPDYRFSLANERTFLALIGTSLALIADGAAIHQFAHDLRPEPLRLAIVLVLFGAGASLDGTAYWRWADVEKAIWHDRDLPLSPLLLAARLCAIVVLG